jgi:hypothetical protein
LFLLAQLRAFLRTNLQNECPKLRSELFGATQATLVFFAGGVFLLSVHSHKPRLISGRGKISVSDGAFWIRQHRWAHGFGLCKVVFRVGVVVYEAQEAKGLRQSGARGGIVQDANKPFRSRPM